MRALQKGRLWQVIILIMMVIFLPDKLGRILSQMPDYILFNWILGIVVSPIFVGLLVIIGIFIRKVYLYIKTGEWEDENNYN